MSYETLLRLLGMDKDASDLYVIDRALIPRKLGLPKGGGEHEAISDAMEEMGRVSWGELMKPADFSSSKIRIKRPHRTYEFLHFFTAFWLHY